MRIVKSPVDLPHPFNKVVGFVPTMGAFHRGHLDLMQRARESCDLVVVSLFVNPTQFGANEDFDRYPRDLERDAVLARTTGVDVLFAPDASDVYPRTPATSIHVPTVTELWEGEIRPTHFDGVATVVAKLFSMVRPNFAYFGQKDLQQCRVIETLVEDLNIPVDIAICPTTREGDGLAMSSRNVYLSARERQVAPMIYSELTRCANIFRKSLEGTQVKDELAFSRQTLQDHGFDVDYFEWVSYETLRPVTAHEGRTALIAAAKLGRTRLIDNVIL